MEFIVNWWGQVFEYIIQPEVIKDMLKVAAGEAVKAAATILALWIGARIALRKYKYERGAQSVTKRYLDEGIDAIATHLQDAIDATVYNFARAVEICKLFRDAPEVFDRAQLTQGFATFPPAQLQLIAQHRVGRVIGSQALWYCYQDAIANCRNANAEFTHQLAAGISRFEKRSASDHARHEFTDKVMAHLQKIHDDTYRYADVMKALDDLAKILEREPYGYMDLDKFRSRPDVQAVIAELTREFPKAAGYASERVVG